MLLRGKLWDYPEEVTIFSEDKCDFWTPAEDPSYIDDWIYCLNHPWSDSWSGEAVYYNTEPYIGDGFLVPTEHDPKFRCECEVNCYDGLAAYCIGYGDTEEEALRDCKELLHYLQETYKQKEGNKMSDYIKREDALRIAKAFSETLLTALLNISAADVRPDVYAHWVVIDDGGADYDYYEAKCSHCGETVYHYPPEYCPKCGAKMRR